MSDSHAESPQQQDAENDIAGVSVHGSCCSEKIQNKYRKLLTKSFHCSDALCGIVQCIESFTWN